MSEPASSEEAPIVLVGARGSGKSTVGRLLADGLEREFFDSDAEIERVVGRPIPEIFAAHGESAFRVVEAEVIAALLQRGACVLATGGGAVLHADTRERLAAAGAVIYLEADVATLHARTAGDAVSGKNRRPPLTDLSAEEEIAAVLAAREPLYREVASLTVDATAAPEDVATAIRDGLR